MVKINRKISAMPYILWPAVICLLVTISCFPRPTVPLEIIEYGTPDETGHKNLLVFLRGIGASPEDFEKHGLIDEVRTRGLPFDIAVPNTHFGYYRSRTLEDRLKHDLIEPAKRKGYEQIWLAGFSMGGLGSLFYIRSYKTDVDGIMLISPFMGWETFLDQIESSGGVQSWSPKANTDNWQHLIWGWVKDYAKAPDDYPPVFLGYGTDDTMTNQGPELLSAVLPQDRIFKVPGGHRYKVFKLIWKTHLDRLEKRFINLPR